MTTIGPDASYYEDPAMYNAPDPEPTLAELRGDMAKRLVVALRLDDGLAIGAMDFIIDQLDLHDSSYEQIIKMFERGRK